MNCMLQEWIAARIQVCNVCLPLCNSLWLNRSEPLFLSIFIFSSWEPFQSIIVTNVKSSEVCVSIKSTFSPVVVWITWVLSVTVYKLQKLIHMSFILKCFIPRYSKCILAFQPVTSVCCWSAVLLLNYLYRKFDYLSCKSQGIWRKSI